MRRALLAALAIATALLPRSATAQTTQDFQLWKGVILQKSFLDGRLKAAMNEEVRLRNNCSEVGNAYTDLNLGYDVLKSLSISAGYRYSVRPEVNEHRVYSDLTWAPDFDSRVAIVLRTRLQRDLSPVERETHLRPRLNLFYNLPKTKLEPFIGVEPFFHLAGALSELDGIRLYAGLRYPVRKKVELRAGYILDRDLGTPTPDLNHVASIRLVIDLDKSDDKDDDKRRIQPGT